MAAFLSGTTSRVLRGSRVPRRRPMSEINVTPFVDVMLVLLIVFMVTAPLLTVGVPVDLPQTRAKSLGEDREPGKHAVDGRTPLASHANGQHDGECLDGLDQGREERRQGRDEEAVHEVIFLHGPRRCRRLSSRRTRGPSAWFRVGS